MNSLLGRSLINTVSKFRRWQHRCSLYEEIMAWSGETATSEELSMCPSQWKPLACGSQYAGCTLVPLALRGEPLCSAQTTQPYETTLSITVIWVQIIISTFRGNKVYFSFYSPNTWKPQLSVIYVPPTPLSQPCPSDLFTFPWPYWHSCLIIYFPQSAWSFVEWSRT